MKTIQITRENLGTVLQLPCVEMCFKTVSGNFRFKGTFETKGHYAQETDWLIQISEKRWKCIPDTEYQRVKDKL